MRQIYAFDGTPLEGGAGFRAPVYQPISEDIEGYVTPLEPFLEEEKGHEIFFRHEGYLSEFSPSVPPTQRLDSAEIWYLSTHALEGLMNEFVDFAISKSLTFLNQESFEKSVRYARQGLMIADHRSQEFKILYSILLRNPLLRGDLIKREIEIMCPNSHEEVFQLAQSHV